MAKWMVPADSTCWIGLVRYTLGPSNCGGALLTGGNLLMHMRWAAGCMVQLGFPGLEGMGVIMAHPCRA